MLESAKAYEEKLPPVQEIVSFARVTLNLDLTKLQQEYWLLANGTKTLREMCVKLMNAEMYDPCVKMLSNDLLDYTMLINENSLVNEMTNNVGARMYDKSKQFSDQLKHSPFNTTIQLEDRNMQQLSEFQGSLAKLIREASTQNELSAMLINLALLNRSINCIAQSVARKQTAIRLLATPLSNVFSLFDPLEHLMTVQEKHQLLAIVTNHFDKLNIPTELRGTSLSNIFQIVDYKYFVSPDRIVVKLRIPLLTKAIYRAVRVTILPAIIEDVLEFPQIYNNVMLIDEEKNLTSTISYNHYRSFCKLLPNKTLCEFQQNNDRTALLARTCTHSILFAQSLSMCEMFVMRCKFNVWLATGNPNIWLYVFPQAEIVMVTVNGKQTSKPLFGSGILILAPNMTVHSVDYILQHQHGCVAEKGQLRTLNFQMTHHTRSAILKLQIPEVQTRGKKILRDKEIHSFFASGVAAKVLMLTPEEEHDPIIEDFNIMLYSLVIIFTLLILFLHLLMISISQTKRKAPCNTQNVVFDEIVKNNEKK